MAAIIAGIGLIVSIAIAANVSYPICFLIMLPGIRVTLRCLGTASDLIGKKLSTLGTAIDPDKQDDKNYSYQRA